MDTRLPLVLAELHRATAVGAHARFHTETDTDPLALQRVVDGAGFALDSVRRSAVAVTRVRSLPDTVGPGMRVLLVGLNPSLYSADRGVPFARPGNRFWPAALRSGLVTRDRDPDHALREHGVGMTDLVKRATARAAELSASEYRRGSERVAALVEWLTPDTVCFVGLSGYRIAVDRRATTGWQSEPFGGRPAYVMPNPSGLNAHAPPAVLVEHLKQLRA